MFKVRIEKHNSAELNKNVYCAHCSKIIEKSQNCIVLEFLLENMRNFSCVTSPIINVVSEIILCKECWTKFKLKIQEEKFNL